MASNDDEIFLQCCKCQRKLDMEGKTLTCLHSLCKTCVNKEIQRQTSGNGQCPLCDEIVHINQLTLSPILVSYLKCQQIESTDWQCDLCLEDGKESIARNWCNNCRNFFCAGCNAFHKKFHKQHYTIDLAGIGQEEIRELIRTDMCKIHYEIEESYCKQCNMCLCYTCYTRHVNDLGDCSSRPSSVRKEALKKLEHEGPTLLKEIKDLEKVLEKRKEKLRIYSESLEKHCYLKCEELWQNSEIIIKELRNKTHKICDELQQTTKQQIKKWQKLLQENERMLEKLKIWRINLNHLLKKGPKEKDIVLGVELVARKWESSSLKFHEKINEPLRELQVRERFSDFWQNYLQKLQNEVIGSGFLDYKDDLIHFENEWNLPESKYERWIESIIVSEKDGHIFLADNSDNFSIIELNESGKFVCEFILIDKGEKFLPLGLFFNSSDILGVNCGRNGEKLFFLEREKNSPFLKIKNVINKEERKFSSFSVCQIKDKILFCDKKKIQIDFYTEQGKYIKHIDTGESAVMWPRIRADSSTDNFWSAIPDTCKIFRFNENGEKLQTLETKNIISDFFINEFGEFYFCNFEGVFAFFPEINLHKKLHEFQNISGPWPKIFVSREKIFVCLQSDEKKTFN